MKIHVERQKLRTVLEENKAKHRQVFLEAQEGYRQTAIERFERALQAARDGKRIEGSIVLRPPVDQTREYERAIRMLDMAVEDTIELSETEFECYVLDRWPWRQQFLSANMGYSKLASDLYEAEAGSAE